MKPNATIQANSFNRIDDEVVLYKIVGRMLYIGE